MFKATRWRSEKNKIKIVFRLEFHATKMTKLGWESAMVSIGPVDEGKPSKKSEKVTVMDGSCQWRKPIYETVKFVQDPKTGKINDKLYKFTVSAMGTAKGVVIGEVTINLAEYAEALKSYLISLPLRGSDSGPILHASIQKAQTDSQRRRETEENGGIPNGEIEKVACRLNNNDEEDNGIFDIYNEQITSPTKKIMHMFTGFQKNHIDSNINTISTLDATKSSEQYFAGDDIKSHSPLSTVSTQNRKSIDAIKDHQRSLSISSGPEVSTDESTNSSTLRFQDSDLEMQTITKQLVKETKQGKFLAQELNKMKEERDALKRKCEEFTGLPHSEEIKQELIHERNINANLRLQLEKTQESNSELILAVEELEKILEQKNKETISEIKSRSSDLHVYDCRQEILETMSEEDNEQYMLEELVKGHRDMNMPYSLEQQIMNLQNDIQFYKKDREELEMQMEQLALDYEIVKQENHGISSKLEQSTLREQLRMQYECSAHSSIISDLKSQIEKQAEAYEVDLQNLVQTKVEQEQRAIKAEEALRSLRWNNALKAENLQKEFEMLSAQMSATFNMNEKLAVKAVEEAGELRLQKCSLENILAETQREISALRKHNDEKNKSFVDERRILKKLTEENKLSIQKRNLERSTLQEEVEKSERELKDIQISMEKKEMLVKTLNSEAEILRVQYKELKDTLFDNEEEKENLRKQVQNLRSDLQKKENEISSVEKKLRDCNSKMNTRNRNNAGSNTSKEIANLRERIKLLEGKIKVKDATIENTKKSFSIKEKELINKIEELQEKSCCDITQKKAKVLDGKSHEEGINGSSIEPTISTIHLTPTCQKNKPEMLSQMLEYKERDKTMEAELKEMQERYSEISLKFAEVEGERQQLVMTVRTLKNSLKN